MAPNRKELMALRVKVAWLAAAAALLAGCGSAGTTNLPTPAPTASPPPSALPVHIVEPSQYSNGTASVSMPGTAAYIAAVDVAAVAALHYTVAVTPETSSAHAATRASRPAQPLQPQDDVPVSRQETEALRDAYRTPPGGPGPATAAGPAPSYSEGQARQFWICTTPFSSCSTTTQARITATAVAVTTRSAIFVDNDNLSDVPPALARTLAAAADQAWARITDNLGLPSNRYNPEGLGQIIYLFTRRVEQIDPNVAGFFQPADLYADGDTVLYWGVHSNEVNMVYLHSRYASQAWMPSTMAHELAHLVHYSRRVFVHRARFDPPYFVEGLAQAMEDVAGYGYNNQGGTKQRVSSFLRESHLVYLASWGYGAASIRSYYGGAYLFARYLLDRFGPDALSRMINSTLDTQAAVEHVSGEPYGRTFSSIGIAIMNSSERLGIRDPRWQYTSIDVSEAGSLNFLSPGPQSTGQLNWRFILGQTGAPRVRVTITATTSTPYVGITTR